MPKSSTPLILPQRPLTTNRWLELFLEFIGQLSIDSKELGSTGRGGWPLYGSQKRFLSEICFGLEQGIHTFLCLKARQLGISTVSLAIDLFWLSVHKGMQGALVTDTEGNRNKFRIILERFIGSLPSAWQAGIDKSNRDNLVFANGSVLDYIVAGKKASKTDIARGRAYNLLHATEVSNFGSEEGVVSLFATLAEKHPERLFMFESTAKGFNLFWQMWKNAQQDPQTQKAFFIGWWAKEDYAISRANPLFAKYWDGDISQPEQELVNELKTRYDVHLRPEQIAWYRWKMDRRLGTESLMQQEYPSTEDEAFIHTGSQFFANKKVALAIQRLDANPPPFRSYVYMLGEDFMKTKVLPSDELNELELKVWEDPSPLGRYVMGVDPAYGRSENQDRTVISLWRCYADRLVQVAEYATPRPETYQAAWVMAHLAGAYKNVMLNVEVSGPGIALLPELRHLKQLFDTNVLVVPSGHTLENLFEGVRWFLYHREDSPGVGYFYGWKTSFENKLTIMNQLRDTFSIDAIEIRSIELVLEMQGLVQDGLRIEAASGALKDDRVMAAALAHKAWVQWVRQDQVQEGETFEQVWKAEEKRLEGKTENMVSYIVSDFFRAQERAREEEEIDQMWE